MHIAAKNTDYEMLKFLKEQKGVDFNLVDENMETPLYQAIHNKDLELVKFLVEQCSANVHHQGSFQRTPVYFAATSDQVDITQYFIQKKDQNAENDMYLNIAFGGIALAVTGFLAWRALKK